jgi:hypothetical protein
MSNTFFSHVLDDPYYIGNGEYLSVITTGKVRVEGEAVRDFNKDAAAKAGLLRVNTRTKETTFIDFNKHSEVGDRYRCVEVIDGVAYVMRTQKKHVDSVVRIAAVDLATNEVTMIEEKAVSIHGTETPKTFCGHFNFGRPIAVGKKIIYPPLNSGVVIVFDTETRSFVAHDVPDDTASIWCTYVPELNEVVFFPYGNRTTKLLVLNLTTNEHKFIEAPVQSTFYNAFAHNGKAVGVPLTMGGAVDKMHFWVYDGKTVEAFEYSPAATETGTGMMGFKYGVEADNVYYTHTIWNKGNELVKFDLINKTVESIKTDMPLGCKPYVADSGVFLFPGIQGPSMTDAPASVYKVEGDKLVEEFKLPTNNLTYGPINTTDKTILFVPYRFDLNAENKLSSVLTIVDLESKSAETVNIELELE